MWILPFKKLRAGGGPEEREWMMYARSVRSGEVSFDSVMILQRTS